MEFKVIYLEKNQGHGNARRISLDNCTNELVALMDADDISYPNRFEKQVVAFEKDSSIDIVGGQITEFIGDPNNIIDRRVVPTEDKDIKDYMKKRCPMNQVSVMFKKSTYNKVGGYIDWYCEEDYYLWIRMALANCKFHNIDEDLVNVRIGDEMSSRRGGMKYFNSEKGIQKLMLKNKIISYSRYLYNVLIRFGGEVILTDKIRTKLFKKLRSKENLPLIKNEYIDIKENKEGRFSVAMCVYGGDNAEWFDSSLSSIMNQTLKPNELVLVVDGPIPLEIENVIKKHKQKILRSNKIEKNWNFNGSYRI